MYYCDYIVERGTSCLKITAERFLDFQHNDNELIMQGTPKWWDDYVASKINLYDFDVYFLCAYTAMHGQHNRLTDYKKVWGLYKTDKGFYDNYYDNIKGRVYFGVKKGDKQQLLYDMASSTVLLLPHGVTLDANEIFGILKMHKFDFTETKVCECQALAAISLLYEGGILLKYNSTHEVSLLIFKSKLENWFDKNTLFFYEGANETLYRKA